MELANNVSLLGLRSGQEFFDSMPDRVQVVRKSFRLAGQRLLNTR